MKKTRTSRIQIFAVPDFRNLGVLLRFFVVLLILMLLLPILWREDSYKLRLSGLMAWAIPASLFTVVALSLANRLIHKNYFFAPLWVVGLSSIIFGISAKTLAPHDAFLIKDYLCLISGIVLSMHYQMLIQKAYSPALAEAQLSALTARIRPHFLFNSLNAAISLIRIRPDDAEMVLENLADLFRAQLKEATQESTLEREIELAHGYIDIEQIRMGEERLKVQWNIHAPNNARVPQLLLQPLLENAVYHGIEPSENNGLISINIIQKGSWIFIRVDNPLPKKPRKESRKGNHMALSNLADRLFLMYDHDAVLHYQAMEHIYRVDIRLPYHRAPLITPNKKP